ncbi:MAG TPA: PIN domain-containing protein [Candidatus Acidoferrum sp.]|jgi:predicted nucleic acid-binding protein
MTGNAPQKVYLDTAVLVAASVAGHPHHRQSLATLLLIRGKSMLGCISGHGLSEMYAVLTRAPFTPPIFPSEARQLLAANVLPYFEIITITPEMHRETIDHCADHGWIGGRIYDALHLCCARKAACDRIYTFNVRHFQQLAPDLADRIGAPSGLL